MGYHSSGANYWPRVGWTNLEEVGVPTEHGNNNKLSSHYMTMALNALQFSTEVPIEVDGSSVACFLNWILYLIGMWFGKDQRPYIIKTHVSEVMGLRLGISIMRTIGSPCVSS